MLRHDYEFSRPLTTDERAARVHGRYTGRSTKCRRSGAGAPGTPVQAVLLLQKRKDLFLILHDDIQLLLIPLDVILIILDHILILQQSSLVVQNPLLIGENFTL
jgi:hypothetical protein